VRPEPLRRSALVDRLADVLAADGRAGRLRVAVDGPRVAAGAALAADLVGPLRTRGRPALRVSAWDFLRPASLRFELGRDDPDGFYDSWFDVSALGREVLGPLGDGGTGEHPLALWDPVADRAMRAARVSAPVDAVLLLDGPFLLRPELAWGFDSTIHLALSPAARRRRVPAADARRELPAYDRYDAEVAPVETADLVVRLDDPARPALLDRRSGQEATRNWRR
jgi:hypothetical protein